MPTMLEKTTICENCGTENSNRNSFCAECGTKIKTETGKQEYKFKPLQETKTNYSNRMAAILGVWGIVNLIFGSVLGAGVLIFFAILVFASKSLRAIYAFAIIWLLIALFQLIMGVLNLQGYYEANGPLLIFLAIINFAFGGWTIYDTRKFEGKI